MRLPALAPISNLPRHWPCAAARHAAAGHAARSKTHARFALRPHGPFVEVAGSFCIPGFRTAGASMPKSAKISRASPVVLRLADQRHWSRLAFLMAANKTRLPARPTQPAIPRPPSRASPSQGNIISLAARKARPRGSRPRPRTSNHHVSATLCLIIIHT